MSSSTTHKSSNYITQLLFKYNTRVTKMQDWVMVE